MVLDLISPTRDYGHLFENSRIAYTWGGVRGQGLDSMGQERPSLEVSRSTSFPDLGRSGKPNFSITFYSDSWEFKGVVHKARNPVSRECMRFLGEDKDCVAAQREGSPRLTWEECRQTLNPDGPRQSLVFLKARKGNRDQR